MAQLRAHTVALCLSIEATILIHKAGLASRKVMASQSPHLLAACNDLSIRRGKSQCCRTQFCLGFAVRLSFEFLRCLVTKR